MSAPTDKAAPETTQPTDLRDWFAGMAIQGFCLHGLPPGMSDPDIAKHAYTLADAMIVQKPLPTKDQP